MLLAAPALFAQSEDSPRQVLDDCIVTLGSEVLGLEHMEAACPGLKSALDRLGLTAMLPAYQGSLLTRAGLINLRSLLQRYERPPERGQISVDGVHAVLESMREPAQAEQSQSWYHRFRRWLREAFDKREDRANPWLRRWLDEHPVSETVQLALYYAVLLLVVVLAIVIIVNEVRAARIGWRKSRTGVAGNHDPEAMIGSSRAGSRGARAAALLRSLIDTLVRTGRLHGAQSLTNRELMMRAKFDDAAQRDSFGRVTQLAEREIFGSRRVHSEDVEDVVQAGERLNAQLNGAAT